MQPSRPSTTAGSVQRRFAIPCPSLRPYVERIWSWTSRTAVELPTVLPGTGTELFLHFGTPFWVEQAHGGRTSLAAGHLLSLQSHVCRLVATGPVGFIAIRFRTGALRHFTRRPLVELSDRFAPIDEAFGADGFSLLSAIRRANRFSDRVRCAETHLLAWMRRVATRPGPADLAIARLYYSAGRDRIREVVRELGTSDRQLERLVQSALGLSPKRFQRLARFYHVARRLHLARCTTNKQVFLLPERF